jgi:16S rRNA (cytosine1402-N4)-methyltransferase
MASEYHIPVLADRVLHYLVTTPDGIYADGTAGGGGHAELILSRLSPAGTLVCVDRDQDAIDFARTRLNAAGNRCRFIVDNFANMKTRLHNIGVDQLSGILLDLGVSSHQIDRPERGFSFQADARLDMRMDASQQADAAAIIATYSESELSRIFFEYGEEQRARRIAREIARQRHLRPISTTRELSDVVLSVAGRHMPQKTLSRVFQALRIEVNAELEHLKKGLRDGLDLLAPGGRFVVIAYHSLEDRIVKKFFQDEAATMIPSGHKLLPDRPRQARLSVLTRRPVQPEESEVAANSRSRSAKLRAAERI